MTCQYCGAVLVSSEMLPTDGVATLIFACGRIRDEEDDWRSEECKWREQKNQEEATS